MIDVTATVAEITAALKAYNALPAQHECGTCTQTVPGRPAPMECGTCGTKATVTVNRLSLDHGGAWQIGTTQNAGLLGFQRKGDDSEELECGACRKAAEEKAHADAEKARADAAAAAEE